MCHQLIVSRDGFVSVPDDEIEDKDMQDQNQDHHGQLEKEIKRGREDLPGRQQPEQGGVPEEGTLLRLLAWSRSS